MKPTSETCRSDQNTLTLRSLFLASILQNVYFCSCRTNDRASALLKCIIILGRRTFILVFRDVFTRNITAVYIVSGETRNGRQFFFFHVSKHDDILATCNVIARILNLSLLIFIRIISFFFFLIFQHYNAYIARKKNIAAKKFQYFSWIMYREGRAQWGAVYCIPTEKNATSYYVRRREIQNTSLTRSRFVRRGRRRGVQGDRNPRTVYSVNSARGNPKFVNLRMRIDCGKQKRQFARDG